LILQGLAEAELGNFEAAEELLNTAYRKLGDHPEQRYNLALGYNLLSKYNKVVAVLGDFVLDDAAGPEHFALLATALDRNNEPDRAYDILKMGLTRYPKSGRLCREMGVFFSRKLNFDTAVLFWEKGVKVEPDFPLNYYHLCKYFSQTPERLWTILYGETFLNLELPGLQTREVARLVWAAWQQGLEVPTDSTIRANYTQQQQLAFDTNGEPILPLVMGLQANLAVAARQLQRAGHLPRNTPLDLATQIRLRKNWLDILEKQECLTTYPADLLRHWLLIHKNNLTDLYVAALYLETQPAANALVAAENERFKSLAELLRNQPLKVTHQGAVFRGCFLP
jgi:tetratricopeptide (TPR) repeat protein